MEDDILVVELLGLLVFDGVEEAGGGAHGPAPKDEVFEVEFLLEVGQYAVYK